MRKKNMLDKDSGWTGKLCNYSILLTALQTGCLASYSPPAGDHQEFNSLRHIVETWTDIKQHPFPGDLEETILTQAKQNQVIIFGEDHLVEMDNYFVGDLLERLQQQGYQHLMVELPEKYQNTVEQFMEGRIEGEELLETINLRIYPDFLYLLTQAKDAGMKVHCMDVNDPSNRNISEDKNRDKEMAKNIERLMDKEPQAKIVIFVGAAHAWEDSYLTPPSKGDNLFGDDCPLGCQLSEITRGKSYSVILDRGYAVDVDQIRGFPLREGRDVDLIANPPKRYLCPTVPEYCK